MSRPLVSICLPNLNNRAFLRERIDTIRAQTYQHWELVISDNYSDDGAWEFFQTLAAADQRVRIAQAPREGMYANWNRCVERARGDYIYIATSDDTLDARALELMVDALERHPECGLAHCPLKIVDERGREGSPWWWTDSVFALSSGALLRQPHVRRAPWDGVLHLLGRSVYISITQLLIRRSLFDIVGAFEPRWASVGDFNWDMRASLVAHTVHVPGTWGGWRVHSAQATAGAAIGSAAHEQRLDAMIEHAIERSRPRLPPSVAGAIAGWAVEARRLRAFEHEVASHRALSPVRRRAYLAGRAITGSAPAWDYITRRVRKQSPLDRIRRQLGDAGCGSHLLVPASSGLGC